MFDPDSVFTLFLGYLDSTHIIMAASTVGNVRNEPAGTGEH